MPSPNPQFANCEIVNYKGVITLYEVAIVMVELDKSSTSLIKKATPLEVERYLRQNTKQ